MSKISSVGGVVASIILAVFCLLAGCLDCNFLGFYGLYHIGASSFNFLQDLEDS